MNPFEIYIAYVSWGDDGKRRPVLVWAKQESEVSVFGITTQYQSKSAAIQSKYLAINDWQQAGFDKQSYIDTCRIIDLPITAIDKTLIGELSTEDKQRLLEFLLDMPL